ncbi:MAG: glycosyltransferase [Actinobacteria bacterium]|nr:glycosyltransferase [Actinomycetota bacterium]
MSGRVTVDGKFFSVANGRFSFRGVTYGTFQRREDGALYPDRDRMKRDLAEIAESGFTLIRTYDSPPDDLLELAADWGLYLLPQPFFPDWRYLVGHSRRDLRELRRRAVTEVRQQARRLAGIPHVLGLCLGNEIPADALRWYGEEPVLRVLRELAETVRAEDPGHLVTYANYPTTEYLSLDFLDFMMFNVFLEDRSAFRRYLSRLQHLAGDRPLVLGEIGMHAGSGPVGERQQAQMLGWMLETAVERGVGGTCVFSWTDDWWVGGRKVEGWRFGLTREDRAARPALDVAGDWNRRTVRDLDFDWPSISVVVCAYNAEATLDECLRHTVELDYPRFEVMVIDDGSEDRTAQIARRHPSVRLVEIEHAGLAVARNEGLRHATGEIVAYLDADAYPSPEWPYFLALGFATRRVGGVGGPNIPPSDDPRTAHQVARSPGGPVHVLVSDEYAEHVPGCNMAFWKDVLEQVGGFDPIYTAAGDDVDLCWRVLDAGWDIGFHPAALVWHRRRGSLRAYLRQQRGYGRSEALVESRHPDRYTPAGTARWTGRIYSSSAPPRGRQRLYRGEYGTAAYQSVYRDGGHAADLVHQVGLPVAAALIATAPVALLHPLAAAPAAAAALFAIALYVYDVLQCVPPRSMRRGTWSFRAGVALMHVLQPLVRHWARRRHRHAARADLPPRLHVAGSVQRGRGGTLVMPADGARQEFARLLVESLRSTGARIVAATAWEPRDARISTSWFVRGDLLTSLHVEDYFQVRIRPTLRWTWLAVALCATVAASAVVPLVGALLGLAVIADAVTGLLRLRRLVPRTLRMCADA